MNMNGDMAARTIKVETWQEFDALPRRIKEVFWRAPYRFSAANRVKELRRGVPVETVRAASIRNVLAIREASILACWGPDHPMLERNGGAGRSRV